MLLLFIDRSSLCMKRIMTFVRHSILLFCILGFFFSRPAHSLELFGRSSIGSTDISEFPKWQRALQFHRQQRPEQWQGGCSHNGCIAQLWINLRDQAQQLHGPAQLAYVNQALNQVRYIQDIVNWGIEDYWATPLEFLIRNGDCEDYAIAKYMMLRELGWDTSDMVIAISHDASLNLLHSILAVNANSTTYILDNQIKDLRTDQQIYHYLPIYAINQHGWWRFQ